MIKRRVVVGIAAAACATLLGACGYDAPDVTTTEHNSVQAAEFHVGLVGVGDLSVTTALTATGPQNFLTATIVNNEPTRDTLLGITSPDGTVTLSGAGVGGEGGSSLTLPPGIPVLIQQPLLSPAGPTATLKSTKTPELGGYVPLQFTFANAAQPSPMVQAPVVAPDQTTNVFSPVPTTVATPPAVDGDPAN